MIIKKFLIYSAVVIIPLIEGIFLIYSNIMFGFYHITSGPSEMTRK